MYPSPNYSPSILVSFLVNSEQYLAVSVAVSFQSELKCGTNQELAASATEDYAPTLNNNNIPSHHCFYNQLENVVATFLGNQHGYNVAVFIFRKWENISKFS